MGALFSAQYVASSGSHSVLAGTAYLQVCVYRFDGDSSCFIQLEILLLCARPEEGQVGFIPYFERPGFHCCQAITINKMHDKGLDEICPRLHRSGGRDIAAIKTKLAISRSQL